MSLAQGTRLGSFSIVSTLGQGGMGVVYRARDLELGREVALKLLPDSLTADPDRLARLEREARLLASLNHPRIATLYGFHRIEVEGSSVPFLVMELVEGETLADRIQRGPMPWREAVTLFDAIAEGLKAAHDSGIVHRDLKPANIKLDPEGDPKILDFGLARAAEGSAAGAAAGSNSLSPTLTAAPTMAGMLLGTAAYMSPEQARGREADRRADIWAFGCCLYEALTGHRPFEGEDVSLILAAILTREPDWSRLPADLPPSLRRLIDRCLTKDQRGRLQDLGDARYWLHEAQTETVGAAEPESPPAGGRLRTLATMALPALVLGLALGWAASPRFRSARQPEQETPPVVRFQVPGTSALPSGTNILGRPLVVHPSGTKFAFRVATPDDESIHQHDLVSGETTRVAGTDGGRDPFYSDDGVWLGFLREGVIYKVPVDGGLPQRVGETPGGNVAGFAWSGDRIVFAARFSSAKGIFEIPARGGPAERISPEIPEDPGGLAQYAYPSFIGHRDALVYGRALEVEPDYHLVALDLETGVEHDLGIRGRGARYVDSGHLVFARGDSIWAVGFDAENLRTVGEAWPFLRLPQTSSVTVLFGMSANGTFVSLQPRLSDLVTVSPEGARTTLPVDPGVLRHPRWSPDGRWIAYTRGGVGLAQIWLLELASGRQRRLAEFNTVFPVWADDGRIVFFSPRSPDTASPDERSGYYIQIADPSRPEEATSLVGDEVPIIPLSISKAGSLLFQKGGDLYHLELSEPGRAEPWLERASSAAFSPDGRWVAYVARDGEQDRAWVRPFPGPGAATPISVHEGEQPAWAPDGSRIYFVTEQGVEEVAVTLSGGSLELGEPRPVFALVNAVSGNRQYDPSPDGSGFIAVEPRKESSGFGVILGLSRELRERSARESSPDR